MVSLIWDKDKNCPTTTVTLASVSINFFSLYCNGGVIGLCLPKSSLKWRDTHSTNPNVFFFFLLLFQVECNGWGDAMLEFAETGFSLRHTGELFYSVLRGGEIWHKDLFNAGCLYAYRRSKDKKKILLDHCKSDFIISQSTIFRIGTHGTRLLSRGAQIPSFVSSLKADQAFQFFYLYKYCLR